MQVYELKLYVYADDIEEVESCKSAVHDFISRQRERGAAVTASKIANAVRQWGGNPLITQYFKS